ncbi:Lovastatin nonaketide synthase [Colletotrichum gloeosporioides]|uniref:Lovastatin nonaketide synthase n=1 Tax=Colletotrichum gloeosporioides TaxID=474922 RepID=A0A8H4C847_COLGL|nr:Lovastatin nonaketide synthase [Colletotrichum gloeosporioides]KAF3799136.1 Lovastatin nonaketide synthase [Colletotrichum gloeosporioides]
MAAITSSAAQLGHLPEPRLKKQTWSNSRSLLRRAELLATDFTNSSLRRLELSALVDWKAEKPLLAKVRPVDSGNLFVNDKTYLLVGLTRDLGRSLARWMVLHGAKYVVLTSRNPRVDPRWIAHVEALGGKVTSLPIPPIPLSHLLAFHCRFLTPNLNFLFSDVANQESVDAGFAKLQDLKLPPTAGIAFGPLVLQDAMLKNMDLWSPRFFDPDGSNPLDFFVMFSPIVAVMGHPGQANYSAANCYLQALAQQRLSKGLTGSTVDIGAVYGIGFVTKAELEEDFNAIRFKFDSAEEHELHTLFAEAVIREQRKDSTAGGGDKGSVKEQLQQAMTLGQLLPSVPFGFGFWERIKLMSLLDNLSAKLRVTLQIPDGEDRHPDVPLMDQGVDSLGAGTIGSWFSKQLLLDLPLLMVFSGASVADLADDAAARLPASAIPLVNQGEDTNADSSDDTRSNTATNETSAGTPLTGSVDSFSDGGAEAFDDDDGPVVVQQGNEDPTVFNNTIGMFMKGAIDLERLSRSLRRCS